MEFPAFVVGRRWQSSTVRTILFTHGRSVWLTAPSKDTALIAASGTSFSGCWGGARQLQCMHAHVMWRAAWLCKRVWGARLEHGVLGREHGELGTAVGRKAATACVSEGDSLLESRILCSNSARYALTSGRSRPGRRTTCATGEEFPERVLVGLPAGHEIGILLQQQPCQVGGLGAQGSEPA